MKKIKLVKKAVKEKGSTKKKTGVRPKKNLKIYPKGIKKGYYV